MTQLNLNAVCAPSEKIVARLIEGEIVIIPLTSGIGDTEDEMYSLNPTGQAIWQKLDGQRTLKDVAELLAAEFEAPPAEIEKDVIGLATELTKRGILAIRNS